MTDKLISIITPVYKAGAYISETFQSVIDQTYNDWEWILVDDHSPDDTTEKIKQMLISSGFVLAEDEDPHTEGYEIGSYVKEDHRITVICLSANKGAAAARNTGLANAGGRYIAFLDADDIWLPEHLEKCIGHMSDPAKGFVFTAYEFGDENAVGTGRIVHVPEVIDYKKALSRTVIFTSTTLFDRQVIPDNLLTMPEVASEDTATWWQILRAGNKAYGIDEVSAVYRRPSGSLSANKITAIKRIWNLYRNIEKLPLVSSMYYFCGWAWRATVRRL